MITFTTPTKQDFRALMENLREGDRTELATTGFGHNPETLWLATRDCTEIQAAWAGDHLLCIYGVQPHDHDPSVGVVWLLGTPDLDRFMFALCKGAKARVAEWLTQYRVLTNLTDKRNRRIILWLRWLGFRLTKCVPINGQPFLIFHQFRPCANQQPS